MMINITNIIKQQLNLLNKPLGEEYNYSCIPLAVIDAVYSIRQDYKTVCKVVRRYCTYYDIGIYKGDSNKKIHTISDLIRNIEKTDINTDTFAKDILHCENKTAGAKPISKAKAVYEFAKTLHNNGIEFFEDFISADKSKLEL